MVRLGVNIDHVATLREARGTRYPDPVYAAMIAQEAGADGITLHLREDRRHIQERDVELLKQQSQVPINLEMAATTAMLLYAEKIKPQYCCLVPEKRQELTTEGGLDVVKNFDVIKNVTQRLTDAGIQVSLFIDPIKEQIDAAIECGAPIVELHTGQYAEASHPALQRQSLDCVIEAAAHAHSQGLIVNAGHGLHYHNVVPVAKIEFINELNIGHSIIAQSVFIGLYRAVKKMKALITACEAINNFV